MPFYESTFIVRQDASPQEVEKLIQSFSEVIKERDGKVVKHELWGLRNLAYRINKYRKGHYVMLCIDAPVRALTELQRQYKLSESVIRSLTIKVDKISEEPSYILRKDETPRREDNDDVESNRRNG